MRRRVLGDRDERRSAAADRVEQADQLRHRRHLHASARCTARAARRRAAPASSTTQRVAFMTCVAVADAARCTATTATHHAEGRQLLPRRAVAGEFIRCSPRTKQPRRNSDANRMPVSKSLTARSRPWRGTARGRSPEHLQHAVGDDVAADDVHRGERARDEQQRRSRGRRVGRSRRAPSRRRATTPWIELAPDISGVCSVAGTLLMTSKPTSRRARRSSCRRRTSRSCALPSSLPSRCGESPGGPLRRRG